MDPELNQNTNNQPAQPSTPQQPVQPSQPIQPQPTPVSQPVMPQSPEPQFSAPATQPVSSGGPKFSPKIMMIIGGVVLGLVLLGVGGWFGYKSLTNSVTESAQDTANKEKEISIGRTSNVKVIKNDVSAYRSQLSYEAYFEVVNNTDSEMGTPEFEGGFYDEEDKLVASILHTFSENSVGFPPPGAHVGYRATSELLEVSKDFNIESVQNLKLKITIKNVKSREEDSYSKNILCDAPQTKITKSGIDVELQSKPSSGTAVHFIELFNDRIVGFADLRGLDFVDNKATIEVDWDSIKADWGYMPNTIEAYCIGSEKN